MIRPDHLPPDTLASAAAGWLGMLFFLVIAGLTLAAVPPQ